jgi:hypothetical protein
MALKQRSMFYVYSFRMFVLDEWKRVTENEWEGRLMFALDTGQCDRYSFHRTSQFRYAFFYYWIGLASYDPYCFFPEYTSTSRSYFSIPDCLSKFLFLYPCLSACCEWLHPKFEERELFQKFGHFTGWLNYDTRQATFRIIFSVRFLNYLSMCYSPCIWSKSRPSQARGASLYTSLCILRNFRLFSRAWEIY